MTDKQTGRLPILKIYDKCGIKYFNDDLQYLIKDVIKELYSTNPDLLLKLRINHIDRAILKYMQAKNKKCISNTKQYFKACVLSAIVESGLDEL